MYKANGYKKAHSFGAFLLQDTEKHTVSFCAKEIRLPFSFGERKKRSAKESSFRLNVVGDFVSLLSHKFDRSTDRRENHISSHSFV